MQSASWQSLHTNQQRLFTYCCQLPQVQRCNRYVQHYARVQIWTKFLFQRGKIHLQLPPVQRWKRYIQHNARMQIVTKFPFQTGKIHFIAAPGSTMKSICSLPKKLVWDKGSKKLVEGGWGGEDVKNWPGLFTRSFPGLRIIKELSIEMLLQLKCVNALCTRSFATFPALQRWTISCVTVFASNHWNSMLADR